MPNKINIAIDGYSSCGKSTLAKALARELNYIFVDSGAMYRAVTLFALRNGYLNNNRLDTEGLINALAEIDISFQHNASAQRAETILNGENVEAEIRQMHVSQQVSKISAIKEVRQKLVALQRAIGTQKGVVMDGRDIGTVVFPNAELKLFMTAATSIRAQRRFDELTAKGQHPTLEEVEANIQQRDYLDSNREESPLRQAEDAIVIDNSHLSPEEQLKQALQLVEQRVANL